MLTRFGTWIGIAVMAAGFFPARSAAADPFSELAEQTNKKLVKLFGAGGFSRLNNFGTGIIISKDGYVLTAAHVADAGRSRRLTDVEEGSEEGGVAHFKLADGREVKGKRLGLFRTQDAGLMKITDPGEYPFAPLAKDVNLNQWCIALGHPGGYQADRGLVLRLGRVLHVDDKAITTDCTLVGGDSGGPLFDMNGRIIGINSRISENLTANMHVPVSTYNDGGNWERMVKGDVWGRLPGQEPAWLGVRGEKDSKGARIAAVTPGSPAEKEGVRPGDVILALDGKPIGDFPALARFIEECRPNESVKVELRRGNQNLEFHVRLSKQP